MKLWRKRTNTLDSVYLTWEYVRDVTDETAERWLAIFQNDEPQSDFCVSLRRPTGRKGRKVMTGRGSTQ